MKTHPIRGVDVSHYQGEIDWDQLAKEDIQFAYIKATEGSSNKDEQFDENWSGAQATNLRIGAYHFFSLDSPGADQAKNFCKNVNAIDGMLPPVVDIEPYGKYRDPNQLDQEKMISELDAYLKSVESFYGIKPVIYTTEEWWPVLQEDFNDYNLWIRDVYGKPDSSIKWTFWQYSNRHVLKGYSGTERYIDMNVFYGEEKEFYMFGM
ncbi:lysozyme [Pseudobutyrivibrio sp. YE44]|uniref:glycoside hydrolase family 25 protein n=1 Tax=Pseudobutyrivibrio sp. YE44 TaxID=1520802 RepID=UPI00088C4CA5|nr:GH25 family lysozyme [Pseudobutyrivibrio sp. YE44]SDB13802.1 lysozyme [Pseudobutyrivibrio sp. YE44]